MSERKISVCCINNHSVSFTSGQDKNKDKFIVCCVCSGQIVTFEFLDTCSENNLVVISPIALEESIKKNFREHISFQMKNFAFICSDGHSFDIKCSELVKKASCPVCGEDSVLIV